MNQPVNTRSISPVFGPIAAIVVTHHIGESIRDTINSIINQVDRIILVDNGSSDATLHILRALTGDKIHLIERSENNLAAAQNAGIHLAKAQGARWVLLVDHDSLFDSGMIKAMEEAFSSLSRLRGRVRAGETDGSANEASQHFPPPNLPPQAGGGVSSNIALLAPALYDRNSDRPPRYLRIWGKFLFKRTGFGDRPFLDDLMCAIASGSLIKISVIDRIGGMDERFVIDDVDREFCLRLITHGYKIVAVKDAILHHQIGECRDHTFMGLGVTTGNHPPARRYTIYRNRIRNWKRYGLKLPGFVLSDILAMTLDLLRILTCEDQKKEKFRALLHGLKDGLS